MYSYFKAYEKYYNSLNDNEQIVKNSESLSISCSNIQKNINNLFTNINSSLWSETGKPTVTNGIFNSLSKNIKNIDNLININLVSACNLSINTLLPKIKLIKSNDEELNNLNNSLITAENNFNSLKNNMPKHKIISDTTKEEIINPDYNVWKTELNNLISKISSLQTQMKTLIVNTETLCKESNDTIEKIMKLDNINETQIKLMLPVYSSYPINFTEINRLDFDELIGANAIITIEQLINDTKSNPPLLPFNINERSIEKTKDGGIRFSFSYQNNGITEKGIILLPPNTTKNNSNIFAFYSGSGGLYIENLNTTFNDTNPPYPMIAFDRNKENGGMSNTNFQSSDQIEATTSAINALKNYLGNTDTKIHAIGHSMGAIELNQIVADKPNYFDTASFINGRIKFAYDQNRIAAYENTGTKLNAFIATNDKNVTLKEQLSSYGDKVDISLNCYNIPINEERKSVEFGDNKIGKYNDVEFEKISTEIPSYINKKYEKIINKTSNNTAKMNVYFIEGASHSGFLPSCLPNQNFYDLILSSKN